jgi:hypothetical protein
MADVVLGYLSNLQELPAPAGLLPPGADVAVVIAPTYRLPPPNTTGPTNCATA